MGVGKIDIVGHFGTTFSYATVASRVALALLEQDRLGTIFNLDPAWSDAHETLKNHRGARGSHVFVVSAPAPLLEMFPGMYGAERSAIFMSPNTDIIDRGHALICAQYDLAIAPSAWSAMSTERGLTEHAPKSLTDVTVSALGVDDNLLLSRQRRASDPVRYDEVTCRLLHVSSDQSWPGRKGTEELLRALSILRKYDAQVALRLHITPALHRSAAMLIRDLDIEDMVDIVVGGRRGSDDGWFERELDRAHMVVAPSRCEGFGIMMASALAAGVPLLTTAVTGQLDFLSHYPGWMALPTDVPGPLAGEPSGQAPRLSPAAIASHLELAATPEVRRRLSNQLCWPYDWENLTWRRAAVDFAQLLMQWQGRE